MSPKKSAQLRVLIANERLDHLGKLAKTVAGLGHEVIGKETKVELVGALTAKIRPDVAIVGLGDSSSHALELITAIVREAFCPVIAILDSYDPEWVDTASQRGLYAYLVDQDPDKLQSALDITLRRYGEYRAVHGAFEQRQRELELETKVTEIKRRQALELHDDVVQSLTVAQMALRLGREDESEAAISTALERAQAIVTRDLVELEKGGLPLEKLIGDAAYVGER